MNASSVVSRLAAAVLVFAPALLQAQPAATTLASSGRQLAGTTIAVIVGGRTMDEGFTFGLGAQRVEFAANQWTGYTYEAPKSFPTPVVRGMPYAVSQLSGPRPCHLYNHTGTAGSGSTTYVYADCNAQPTPFRLSVRAAGTADGETFTVATDAGDQSSQTPPVRQTFLPAGMTSGATIRLWQVGSVPGKTCKLTGDAPWAVTSPGDTVVIRAYSDVYITANCTATATTTAGGTTPGPTPTPTTTGGVGRGPAGALIPPRSRLPVTTGSRPGVGTSSLGGIVRGPIGLRPTLKINGANPLVVAIPAFAGGTDRYNDVPFTFTPPRANGTPYSVTATTADGNSVCTVYDHEFGIMPAPGNPVRVGCEALFDHVSTNTAGTTRATYYESRDAVVGGANEPVAGTYVGYGEGRFVAFMSGASGLTDRKTTARQIYLRDRLTGQTYLLSAAADGTPGNADSYSPAISADGLTVAFESDATNLVSGDNNKVRDVFVWSAANGVFPAGLIRASVGSGGTEANAPSSEATVSGDGRIVAFTSSASNLTPGVPGTDAPNIFRRDTKAGTTTLVTRGMKGPAVGGSRPSISEDGMRIAFQSFSSALVSGDKNGFWDIFVHDFSTGGLQRVSVPQGGGERNQGEESASRIVSPVISGDGNSVAFATTATNLVPGVTKALQNVYVADLRSGRLTRASVTSSGAEGDGASPIEQGERPALSYDGTWVAFPSSSKNFGAPEGNIFLHNNRTGETRPLTTRTNNSAGTPTMSRTAAYIAFGSNNQYDTRVPSSGMFVAFTGIASAFFWMP